VQVAGGGVGEAEVSVLWKADGALAIHSAPAGLAESESWATDIQLRPIHPAPIFEQARGVGGCRLGEEAGRECGVAWASLLGEEEVLAFLHDLQQNHGHEGRMIN